MSYYNQTKASLGPWITNFATTVNAHKVALGVTGPEAGAIEAAAAAYVAALNAQEAARSAATAATEACDLKWRETMEMAALYNARFQANPSIGPALIAELGLKVHSGGSSHVVYNPTNLVATGLSNGVNKLRWNANGNTSGRTTYIIQAMYNNSGSWTIVDTTTRLRFNHTSQTPGVAVQYRIIAKRGTQTSEPSNTASVYTPGLEIVEGGQQAA
jgi:hypothetical protein